ncbi:MAG: hypothetical protein ACK5XN_34285 [Bacteroidota bacterium]|jgi:hypothetical protein
MEIGQQVKWSLNTVGNIKCMGVFLQQLNATTSEVICHYMNDKKCVAKLQVETIKLEQI